MGVCVDETKCDNCGRCIRECKMDVSHVGDMECIQCGEGKAKCPKNAIMSKREFYKLCNKTTDLFLITIDKMLYAKAKASLWL